MPGRNIEGALETCQILVTSGKDIKTSSVSNFIWVNRKNVPYVEHIHYDTARPVGALNISPFLLQYEFTILQDQIIILGL